MTLGNMRANGVRTLAAWCLGRGCDHFRVLDVSGYPDDARLPASKRGTGGLLAEFEGNSRGCVVETAVEGAMHHPVGEVNVHVKRAVIAGVASRLLAIVFSKNANFELVVSGSLNPLDGAGTASFSYELYRPSCLIS